MTAKEQAKSLVDGLYGMTRENLYGYEVRVMKMQDAEEAAHIVADIMIDASPSADFWKQVKTEIDKL